MQKIYLAPSFQIIEMEKQDVVTASAITGTGFDSSTKEYFLDLRGYFNN